MGLMAEVSAWLEPAFAGWRYLFSPAYRARIHDGWKHEKSYFVVFDVIIGILGVAASVVVVCVPIALWAGIP